MALPVTITGISTAVAPVGPFKVSNNRANNAQYRSGGSEAGNSLTNGSWQSFTTTTAVALSGIAFKMSAGVPPGGTLSVQIRSGSSAGTLLATSNSIAASTISTATFYEFTFSSPPSLAASTQYWAVLVWTGASGSANKNVDTTNAYAGGSSDTGISDWYFYTWGEQEAYYFFGRDGTTATTLQAYKPTSSLTVSAGTAGGSTAVFGSGAAATARSQSFTTPSNVGLGISSISLTLKKTGSPADNIKVDIYATDGAGKPTGSSLATSATVAGSTLTASNVSYPFAFTTPFVPSASTQYAAVVSRSGSLDAANNYTWAHSGTDVTAGEHSSLYDGSAWGTPSTVDYPVVVTISVTPDPATAWSSIATKTGFTTAILNIAGYQVGSVIHLLVNDGTASTLVATKYLSFDAATDTFLATTETVLAASAVAGQQGATVFHGSLAVRSNGEVVALYNSTQTNTAGTPRARLGYKRRTALNTWSAAVQVDANTAVDNRFPEVVVTSTDVCHFLWWDGTLTNQRTLTAANALQTASTGVSGVTSQAISFGGDKVVVICATLTYNFTSANTPTLTAGTFPSSITSLPNDLFADGTDVYAIGCFSDGDLYLSKSTNNGGTWGAATNIYTGSIVFGTAGRGNLSRDSSIYQRGSSVVIPYIVNDNAVLKYNEYTIRSLGISGTLTKTQDSNTISAAGNVPFLPITGTLTSTEANDTLSSAATISITGTLSVTEAVDTLSAAGTVASATITGTLSITEANDTLSSTGTVLVGGTLSHTEANDTIAATGGPVATATLSVTEAADTLVSQATVRVGGTLSVTEATDTIFATGGPVARGTLSATETNDTLTAQATVRVNGTLGITEANDTITAAGTVTVGGSLVLTEAADTVSATATVAIGATLNITETADTLSGAATVGFPVITGSLNATEANDTIVATAGPVASLTLTTTQANNTLAATGGPVARGTLSVTETNDTVSATASITVRGTLSTTEANDTLAATTTVTVRGTLSTTEANDTLTAAGLVIPIPVLTPSLYADNDDIITPAVLGGGSTLLSPTLYTDTDTFYIPSIARGAVTLVTTLYDDAAVFYAPAISHRLFANVYTDVDTFHAPVVAAAGVTTLTPILYIDTDNVYGLLITTTVTLASTLYNDIATFYVPSIAITTSEITLSPALYVSPDIVYQASLGGTTRVITPGRYVDSDSIRQTTVGHGAVTIRPSLVASDDLFRVPFVGIPDLVIPNLHVDPNQFYPPAMLGGGFTQRVIDSDIIFTATIYKRRGVRSNIGVVKGRVDQITMVGTNVNAGVIKGHMNNTKHLTGHRDAP